MAYTGQLSRRQHLASIGAALAMVVLVGGWLASGLDLTIVRRASEAITAIAIPAPPPPIPPSIPAETPSERAAGAAAPANRAANPTKIAAPKPKIPPPNPPPITAAPKAATGVAADAGAAPTPGPGTGAGGQGDGLGAGGSGRGSGGGTRAAWRSGTIEDRDYPRDARRARAGGDVEVRFTILPSGRVSGCRVTRSSGDASLDETTCRLIEARFRFRPATDAAGTPVASQYGWRQTWWLERR